MNQSHRQSLHRGGYGQLQIANTKFYCSILLMELSNSQNLLSWSKLIGLKLDVQKVYCWWLLQIATSCLQTLESSTFPLSTAMKGCVSWRGSSARTWCRNLLFAAPCTANRRRQSQSHDFRTPWNNKSLISSKYNCTRKTVKCRFIFQ